MRPYSFAEPIGKRLFPRPVYLSVTYRVRYEKVIDRSVIAYAEKTRPENGADSRNAPDSERVRGDC